MASDLIRVSVRGGGRAAAQFSRAQRQLQDALIAELRAIERDVSDEVRASMRSTFDEDTGDLVDSVRARFFFRATRPRFTVEAGAPGHGGDPRPYLDVLRFGHRQARIRPRKARVLTVHLGGHDSGESRLMRSVRGVGHGGDYVPRDFVADAMPAVRRRAQQGSRELGRRIEVGLLR